MTIPSFVYITVPTTTETSFTSYIFQEIDLNHILFGIIIILSFIITMLIFSKFKRSDHYTHLIIEVTNGSSCVTIPLTRLPLCPSYWEFRLPSTIDYIEVNGTFRPRVTLEWESFSVKNKLTNKSVNVKKNFRISFLQGLKIKQILKEPPYCMHLMVSHQNLYTVINK